MYVDLEVHTDRAAPELLNDVDLLDDRIIKRFSTFRELGQNIYGIRRRDVGTTVIDPKKGKSRIIDLGPSGLVLREHTAYNVHVILGGVPHHSEHSFGYWHINDMDELNLKLPGSPGEAGYSFIIMQKPHGKQGESFAWYCDQCLTMLFERRVATGRFGLGEFWKGETAAVRAYNADPAHRRCPECGHLNPPGYCWNPSKDTPEEAAARLLW
jgi:hypothetical protein